MKDKTYFKNRSELHAHRLSWEAKSFSTSEKILRILWNPKVCFFAYTITLLVIILSQVNTVLSFPSHLWKILYNIILPCKPRSSSLFISFRLPHQFPGDISLLLHNCIMPRPSELLLWFKILAVLIRIIISEQNIVLT